MTAPLLHCFGLTARHGERRLYDRAEIRLPGGTLTVLRGMSGAGKSTLLRQLVGLDEAPGTRRVLNGQDFTPRELWRWRAQVVLSAQDAPILEGTVEQNLAFPYTYRAADGRRFSAEQARHMLDRCGLDVVGLEQSAGQLSGGERHRLALARILLWRPRVLVADEPLTGLDATTAERCWQLLFEYSRQSGHAVLCTLHEEAFAERADRRLELRDGTVVDPNGGG